MKRILFLAAMAPFSFAVAQPAFDPTASMNRSADAPVSQHHVALRTPLSSTEVDVEQQGDQIRVHAQSEVDADLPAVWSTLSDYDHLAQFIPDMSSSRMISRDGRDVVVEQKGATGVGPIRQKFTVLLAVREEPPESIRISGIGGDFKRFDARYDVIQLAPHRSRIGYEATIVPAVPMPPAISLAVMRPLITSQFSALVREVMRRAA